MEITIKSIKTKEELEELYNSIDISSLKDYNTKELIKDYIQELKGIICVDKTECEDFMETPSFFELYGQESKDILSRMISLSIEEFEDLETIESIINDNNLDEIKRLLIFDYSGYYYDYTDYYYESITNGEMDKLDDSNRELIRDFITSKMKEVIYNSTQEEFQKLYEEDFREDIEIDILRSDLDNYIRANNSAIELLESEYQAFESFPLIDESALEQEFKSALDSSEVEQEFEPISYFGESEPYFDEATMEFGLEPEKHLGRLKEILKNPNEQINNTKKTLKGIKGIKEKENELLSRIRDNITEDNKLDFNLLYRNTMVFINDSIRNIENDIFNDREYIKIAAVCDFASSKIDELSKTSTSNRQYVKEQTNNS